MKLFELQAKLEKEKISEKFYSLNGDVSKIGSLVLIRNSRVWQIIGIDDRGNQELIQSFVLEEVACEYLFKKLVAFRDIMEASSQLKNGFKNK